MAIKCSEESVSVYSTDSSLLVLLMEDTTKNPTVEHRIMDSRLEQWFRYMKPLGNNCSGMEINRRLLGIREFMDRRSFELVEKLRPIIYQDFVRLLEFYMKRDNANTAIKALYYKFHYPREFYKTFFKIYGTDLLRQYYPNESSDHFILKKCFSEYKRIIMNDSQIGFQDYYMYLVWEESLQHRFYDEKKIDMWYDALTLPRFYVDLITEPYIGIE